jgi:hypothetical protein
MKKLLLTLFLLLSAIGWAYAKTVTTNWDCSALVTSSTSIANTTYYSADNNVSISFDNSGSSKATAYSGHVRFYTSNVMTISSNYVITKLTFTVTSKDYQTVLNTTLGQLTATGGDENITSEVESSTESSKFYVTWTGSAKSLKITASAQTRFSNIEITYNAPATVTFSYDGESLDTDENNEYNITAKEEETITISSTNASSLKIGDEIISANSYDYPVTKSETITVTPIEEDGTEGTPATLNITAKAKDALDEPKSNVESNTAVHPTAITLSTEVGYIAYSIDGGESYKKTDKNEVSIDLTTDYITSGLTINAYSYLGEQQSDEAVYQYTILRPAKPEFDHVSGKVKEGSYITISASEDVKFIEYTVMTDSDDEKTTKVQGNSVSIPINEYTIVTARAYDEYSVWSEDAEMTYEIADVSSYKLVTSADGLKDGDEVIIVAGTKALSNAKISSNAYSSVDVTVNSGEIDIIDEDVMKFTLTTSSTEKSGYPYIFKTLNYGGSEKASDQKYLGANTSTNLSAPTTESYWNIVFDGENAKIINNESSSRLIMLSNSTTTFKNYASSNYESSDYTKVQLYRLVVADNSTIELEGATIAKTTLNEKVALTEDEGWTEKYPAYYTEANQLLFKYNINSDTDENATYTVEVTAGDETIKVTDAKAGENTVAVPLDGPYSLKLAKITFSDGSEQELNSVLDDLNLNIDFEPADAEFNDKIISGSNFILDWELKNISETLVSYVTYQFANEADEIGVATEDYTALGLKGYTRYDGETFVEANNWARIAAQNGHLPVHFANLQAESDGNYVIIGEIKVVYPFYYNNTLDCKSKELVTTIDIEEYIYKEDIPTSINSVKVDANGEAEYYNLQGVRVYSPANGLYIRKQGNTISKVRL